MTQEQLASLKRHDVVMLDTTTFGEQSEGFIRFSASSAWRVSLSGNQATVLQQEEPQLPKTVGGEGTSLRIACQ